MFCTEVEISYDLVYYGENKIHKSVADMFVPYIFFKIEPFKPIM